MSEDEGEFIEAKREEGTDDLLDDNSMAHLCDEDRLAVSGASTPGVDAPEDTPLQLGSISKWQIVSPVFSFLFRLYPHSSGKQREAKFRLHDGSSHITGKSYFFYSDDWHNMTLETALTRGAVTLYRDWHEPGQNWFGEHDNYSLFVSSLPVIDNKAVFTDKLTGSEGDSTNLRIVVPNTGAAMSATFQAQGNRWSASLLPGILPGRFELIVEQSVSGYIARYSLPRNFLYLTSPKVSTPTNDAVVPLSSELRVVGNYGGEDRIIQLTKENKTDELGRAPANKDGSWEIKFDATAFYPAGGWAILNVRHIESGNDGWTQLRILLLAPPTITPPTSVVDMSTRITGTGHTDLHLNSVNVFLDPLTDTIGGGWVDRTTGAWFADISLPAGRIGITANQFFDKKISERAAVVYFNVRPPKLSEFTVSYEDGKTILSGARHKGAAIYIHIINGANTEFQVTEGSGDWRIEVPATYLPRHSSYTSLQKIGDGGSGWIDSEWSISQSVVVKPRKLTLNEPSLSGQTPTFTGGGGFAWGSGVNQTTVQIHLNGQYQSALVPQSYLSSNGTWTITAAKELPPGSYTITVQQWVNSVWSDPTELSSPLLIKPNQTKFTEPDNSSGQLPQFTLTAWPLALVKLTDNQSTSIKEHAADANGIWRHTANENWNPGPHTVKATQTFGGQTSDLATHSFSIKTPVALITPPPDNEVSPQPVISGVNGWPGSWVIVYSAVGSRPELGRGEVHSDGSWSAPLGKQPVGLLPIYAVQVFNGHASDSGTRLDLTVVIPVPKFDPLPPKPGRTLNLTGSGFFGAMVEVRLKGAPTPLAKDIEVRLDGTWAVQLNLDLGSITLVAIQRYETQFTSNESECSLTVVPNRPLIGTPAENEWSPNLPFFSGSGFPEDTIYVIRHLYGTVLAITKVLSDGSWSIRSESPLSPDADNAYTITAVQVSGQYHSNWAVAREFRLLMPPPEIRLPATGDWVGLTPEFSGTAPADAAITVSAGFNPDEVLAQTTANRQGDWTVTSSKNLPEGGYWVQARASVDGVNSEWIESGRFWVKDGAH